MPKIISNLISAKAHPETYVLSFFSYAFKVMLELYPDLIHKKTRRDTTSIHSVSVARLAMAD